MYKWLIIVSEGLNDGVGLGMINYCPTSVLITWLGLGVYIVMKTYRGLWKDSVIV